MNDLQLIDNIKKYRETVSEIHKLTYDLLTDMSIWDEWIDIIEYPIYSVVTPIVACILSLFSILITLIAKYKYNISEEDLL
jgi:hypothetical protein